MEGVVTHFAAHESDAVVVKEKILVFVFAQQRVDDSAVYRIFSQIAANVLFEKRVPEFFHQTENFGHCHPSEDDALVIEIFLDRLAR